MGEHDESLQAHSLRTGTAGARPARCVVRHAAGGPDCRIWIVEHAGAPAGMVRLEREADRPTETVAVSVYVHGRPAPGSRLGGHRTRLGRCCTGARFLERHRARSPGEPQPLGACSRRWALPPPNGTPITSHFTVESLSDAPMTSSRKASPEGWTGAFRRRLHRAQCLRPIQYRTACPHVRRVLRPLSSALPESCLEVGANVGIN